MDKAELPLTEPVPIDDDLCTKLALIEDLDFGARFVVAAHQTVYETGGQILAVKRKIVLPYSAIGPALEMTVRFMAQRVRRFAGDRLLRRVK